MPDPCLIHVYERQTLLYAGEFAEPVELGRQVRDDEQLLQPRWDRDHWRVAIARPEEQTLSRKFVLVEPLPGKRVKITNQSAYLPVWVSDGFEVAPGATWEAPLPLQLALGDRSVHLRPVAVEDAPLQCLSQPPWAPEDGRLLSGLTVTAGLRVEGETLVRWLHTALEVLQSAATSSDFFAKAARAALDLAGLDTCRVLLLAGDDWHAEALQRAPHLSTDPDVRPSREILQRVRREKRTFWRGKGGSPLDSSSLRGVRAVVAAPILDRRGEVIAVLYGDSWGGRDGAAAPRVSKMEASLVELLAGVVAAGLARLEQERAALALQVRYEQFLPPEVVRLVMEQPELLEEGRDAEVTVLFCDIRGFTRVSARLGPARTFAWVRAVMDALSECVLAHRGTVVNHVGDELVAMWGAPEERPDHAELACRAALAMHAALGPLNERWRRELGEATALGIGLNTGTARVGRTGSQRCLAYGPLGNMVNLASRLQGATRHLKVSPLITAATRERLGPEFACRQLGRVRVVNIAEPVELHELTGAGRPGWEALRDGYEEALARFSAGHFREAVSVLGRLLPQHPDDAPLLLLLGRAVEALAEDSSATDSVWELPGK